jgi:hypothetical protein
MKQDDQNEDEKTMNTSVFSTKANKIDDDMRVLTRFFNEVHNREVVTHIRILNNCVMGD